MSPISDQIGGVILREWIIMPLFLLYEFKFGMSIQIICNLLTSSNNHLLLQLRRWLAPVQELVATMMATAMTYHHRHRRLLRSSLPNSWEAKGQWRKLCTSLRRTQLVPIHSNRGLSQTSTAPLRNFWIQSLLSSRWQRNRYRQMSGSTPLSRSFVC